MALLRKDSPKRLPPKTAAPAVGAGVAGVLELPELPSDPCRRTKTPQSLLHLDGRHNRYAVSLQIGLEDQAEICDLIPPGPRDLPRLPASEVRIRNPVFAYTGIEANGGLCP